METAKGKPLYSLEEVQKRIKNFEGGKGLLKLMDDFLVANDYEKSTKKRTHHYPTDIGTCARQTWYKWNSITPSDPRDAVSIWRMNLGGNIHDLVSNLMKDMGAEFVPEIAVQWHPAELKYKISGRIDNLIEFKNELYVIELKTTFGRGTKAIQESGQPREKDFGQAAAYPAMSQDIKGMYLIYIGRDNFYRTEFFYSEDVKEIGKKAAIEYFQRIEGIIHQKKEPTFRDYQACVKGGEIKDKVQHKTIEYKADWNCTYCIWRSRCYAKEIAKTAESKAIYIMGDMV